MKKTLFAVALASLVVTNAEAGGWHGGHGHGYHGGSYFWWGAAFGAALTIPFYYSRTWAEPAPYYYYGPGYYNPGPTVYIQNPPVYVQSQPVYAAAQPRYAVTQAPSNGVIELGPANTLPPANAGAEPSQNSTGQGGADQWFVYPSKGQNPQQQANDRYDCNRWAVGQSGYDPDLRVHRNPETGPKAYGRALSACLEGRGYAVK